MMFTHPDRKHKPLHPRAAGRLYRGGGPSPWAATAGTKDFHVGGNAFFPGNASSYGGQGGKGGAGTGKSPGAGAGVAAGGAGADGDVTLVEPGKVLVAGKMGRDSDLLAVRRRVRGVERVVLRRWIGLDRRVWIVSVC